MNTPDFILELSRRPAFSNLTEDELTKAMSWLASAKPPRPHPLLQAGWYSADGASELDHLRRLEEWRLIYDKIDALARFNRVREQTRNDALIATAIAAKATPPAAQPATLAEPDVAALITRLLGQMPQRETVRLRTRNRLLGFLKDGAEPRTNAEWAEKLGVSTGIVSLAMATAPETRRLLRGRKARQTALTGRILDSATAHGEAIPDTAADGTDDVLKRLLETCKNAQDREALQHLPRAELHELLKQFGMQADDDASGYVLIENSNQ